MKVEGIGGSWGTKNVFRTRALQWANVNQSGNKSLTKVVYNEGQLQFKAQHIYTKGNHKVQLFKEDSREISLVPHKVVSVKAQAMLGMVLPYSRQS